MLVGWSEGQGVHQTNPQKSRLVADQDLLQAGRGAEQGWEGRRGSAQSRIYCIGEEENQEHIAKFTAEQGREAEQG